MTRRLLPRRRRPRGVREDVRAAARPGAYARARVDDLDRVLVRARNRARALDYELPEQRVRELGLALAADLRRVRDQALAFDLAVELTGDEARWLVRDLTRRRSFAVTGDLDHRRPFAEARALAAQLDADLGRLRRLSQEFVDARQLADSRALVPARPPAPVREAVVDRGPSGDAPTWIAAGLVAHAVRALPAPSRARWHEEFDGELRELVGAAVPRRTQVRHAARVATRVWALRRALRAASHVA